MTDTLPHGITGRLVMAASDYARDRRPWLRERQNSLGASDISAILGLNPHKTPLDVWMEKTGPIADDSDMPEIARWGLLLEHTVAQEFVTRHPEVGKLYPTPGILRHPESDYVHATLDKLLVKRRTKERVAVGAVEVKTAGVFAYRKNWIEDVPPTKTIIQDQIQMGVSGVRVVYNPVLVGGQHMPDPVAKVEFDPAIEEHMITVADDWFVKHVKKGVRPEPTIGDLGKLGDLWPAVESKELVATPQLIKFASLLADAKRRIEEAEADADRAKFEIQREMKDATELLEPGGELLATWRKSKPSKRFDRARFEKDHPELAPEYIIEGKPSRPFKLKGDA